MKAAVITFPGSNCDRDLASAFALAGADVVRVWHKETELPAGTFSFHFRVRASNEGSFVHPAPYAEMMYRESVRGRGVGMRINVKGTHEK